MSQLYYDRDYIDLDDWLAFLYLDVFLFVFLLIHKLKTFNYFQNVEFSAFCMCRLLLTRLSDWQWTRKVMAKHPAIKKYCFFDGMLNLFNSVVYALLRRRISPLKCGFPATACSLAWRLLHGIQKWRARGTRDATGKVVATEGFDWDPWVWLTRCHKAKNVRDTKCGSRRSSLQSKSQEGDQDNRGEFGDHSRGP